MNNKYIHKIAFFILTVMLSALSVSAQSVFWSASRKSVSEIVTDKAVKRQSFPQEFKLFDLNIEPLKNQLLTVVDNKSDSTIISLPNADGGIERFEVFEASNFEPELQAKFPEIRAFSGRGLTDRYATLKLSISPQGVSGMIFRTASGSVEGGGESEFIEPYSVDRGTYAVFRSSRKTGELPWACTTQEKSLFFDWTTKINTLEVPRSSEGTVRTMRLAQSNNGEYSNYFGATSAAQVNLVLAAYNNTLTRANGVYEKDLGLHLNVISESTKLIFYTPATDPYSTTLSEWNDQLRNAIIAAGITTEMYDIGHMFGASGGGGNAGCIGCVCSTGAGLPGHVKGRGITSPADGIPVGDNFDIDFVAHEVGHQLGANHTFSLGSLPVPEMLGQDKEVGSGITIMGYAGITQVDAAPHSIDVFHATSIGQVQANLPTRGCPAAGTIPNANRKPVVAPVANFTIPIMTPFALTGSATDPDGDPLTYNWEQNDSAMNTGVSVANAIAYPAKEIGPNFLTFPSTASPKKLFPRLSTILAGEFMTASLNGDDPAVFVESLNSVTRDLNFRLTVRDNHPYRPGSEIGQTQFADMRVSVTNIAGPFIIAQPNMNEVWASGSAQTVMWAVANTNLAPVNTANVNIKLSLDGGMTFPIILKENTPNDGSEIVTLPTRGTTTARVLVEAVNNIFFDISNTNFTIANANAPNGFESDVQPRPTGDGVVDADDIQQLRRFAVGLDMPYQSTEFQRADPSPRNSSGDGFIDADDVQQARRYAVGTDASQAAGGPMAPFSMNTTEDYSSKSLLEQIIGTENSNANETVGESSMRVAGSQAVVSGQTVTIPVLVNAAGNEAGYTFGLKYNAVVLSNPIVSIGSAGGDVVANVSRAGEIGLSITSFNGGVIAAGADQVLVNVTFTIAANAKNRTTPINFSSSLARQKATGVDPNAPVDQPIYTDGMVKLGRAAMGKNSVSRSGK